MLNKILFSFWILAAICLFLYSFTQVDLSLTLSQASLFQTIQKAFQYVGWFNRPLSAALYILIICLMLGLYLYTLKLASHKKIEWISIWKIVIGVAVVLFFSYNAFSYDLFNYIFDAKILAHYNQNPYLHKALDFPQDPMLSFMRWTHRTYPYGPSWLAITAPVYLLGLGKFFITFYMFKAIMVASFVGSVLLIKRISEKLGINANLAVVAFALNPLVLVESLVSAHNDIVMVFFGLLAVYLFLQEKFVTAAISILISVLIKFVTMLLIPALIAKKFFKLSDEKFLLATFLLMIVGVVVATVRTNFQPWYLLYVLPFAALLWKKPYISIPTVIISFAGLTQYIPYLYLGNWDPPIPTILNGIMIGSIVLSLLIIGLNKANKSA